MRTRLLGRPRPLVSEPWCECVCALGGGHSAAHWCQEAVVCPHSSHPAHASLAKGATWGGLAVCWPFAGRWRGALRKVWFPVKRAGGADVLEACRWRRLWGCVTLSSGETTEPMGVCVGTGVQRYRQESDLTLTKTACPGSQEQAAMV